jgi:anaerobic ribonucleoside-triphosphate reductase activating protein
MTSDLWARQEPRPIEPLVEQLLPHLESSDGLSISGGEPFEQAPAVTELISQIRKRRDVHVLCYSGFKLETLRRRPDAAPLLASLDLLMDGPYLQHEANDKQWRGSDNQRLIPLSERAEATENLDDCFEETRSIQFQRLPDGSVRIIGIPKRNDMEVLSGLVEQLGLTVKKAQ